MGNSLNFAALEASSMRKRHALDLMMLAEKLSRLTVRTKTVVQQSNEVGQKIYRTNRETLDQKLAYKNLAMGGGDD